MKNLFFLAMTVFFAFLSCRNDDADVQKIDQILYLYIDSAGQDMLNNKIKGSYTTVAMNDVYGLTDNAPISADIKKDKDTVSYNEYVAGARRIKIDSSGNSGTYESKIALLLTKKINDSTSRTTNDTLTIQYNFSPQIFQVSNVWYNNQLKFTKEGNEPNIVKISK